MPNTRGSNKVILWRQRARQRLRDAFGARCGICGYDKLAENLVLHHIDKSEKDFSFNQFQSRAWHLLVVEARKCVLLCCRCHGEVHAGIASVDECPRFNEAFATYVRLPSTPGPRRKWCAQQESNLPSPA